MLSFHNDLAVKDKYLSRVRAHQLADNLIRGKGWAEGKGCAVGCTLETYNHSLYPIELGIPEWLAHVEDTLFEGMHEEKSRTWPEIFLEAIPLGADLEKIKGPFLIMVLKSALETFDHAKFPAVKKAIDGSIALWGRNDFGEETAAAESAAAARAARAARAAWAAWAAAEGAAAAAAAAAAWAAAEGAAWAAGAGAAGAARAAARAAWAAAEGAGAGAERYDYFADELLKLLREAI